MTAPIQAPFSFEGKENGFPFCVEKVNVKDNVGDGTGVEYDYWTTLGGFNKDSGGSPTQEQIGNSWINACKLYWNLYGINYTDENGNSFSINVDNDLVDGNAEPKDRAIYPSGSIEISSGLGLGDQVRLKFRNGNAAGVDYSPIVALYDSNTFLGYGLDFPESKDQILAGNQEPFFGDFPILYDTLAISPAQQFLGFCSYAPTLNNYTEGVSYVEISGMHLIKAVLYSAPAGLSEISIDSFEFYTYA